MTPRPAFFATLAVAGVVLIGAALFVAHRLGEPIVPAVIVRSTDAHRLLGKSVGARIGRLIRHETHPPPAHPPRLIALTFDDGPYPVETPLLLDVLDDLHVPATFFLIGDDAIKFPDLERRIHAAGDEIANHTQTHPADFDALPQTEVRQELADGAKTLSAIAPDPSIRRYMRPPHGRFTIRTIVAAQRAGYDVVLWNDDPGDWRSISAQAIEAHMAANATAPDIVLLHSGKLSTIEALPAIVARYRAAGFTFVTAGTLLSRVPNAAVLRPEKLRV